MISMPTPSPPPDEIISSFLASFNFEMIPKQSAARNPMPFFTSKPWRAHINVIELQGIEPIYVCEQDFFFSGSPPFLRHSFYLATSPLVVFYGTNK